MNVYLSQKIIWGPGEVFLYYKQTNKLLLNHVKEGEHLEDVSVVWRIILKWTFDKYGGKMWTKFFLWSTESIVRIL
jgi:hypothetical protein